MTTYFAWIDGAWVEYQLTGREDPVKLMGELQTIIKRHRLLQTQCARLMRENGKLKKELRDSQRIS